MFPLELSEEDPVTEDNMFVLPSNFNAPKKAKMRASL